MARRPAMGTSVMGLAAAATLAAAQVGVGGDWEWESDVMPKAQGRWGLAVNQTDEMGGQVYCTGRTWDSSSNPAIAVWRVDPDGSTAWFKTICPAGSSECNGIAVTGAKVENVQYVWVTGYADGQNGRDIVTACYYDLGDDATLLWMHRYNNHENDCNGDDVPVGILYDSGARKLYVGGDSDGADIYSQSCGKDILVLAYDAIPPATVPPTTDNLPLWPMRYDGTGHGDDHFADFQVVYGPVITSGPAETLVGFYVAGTAWNSGTKNDFVVLKVITGSGAIIAQADFNYDNESGNDICTCMDAAQWDVVADRYVGGVFLGGYTNGLTTDGDDYLTVAFDLDLTGTLWNAPRVYSGPGGGSDRIAKIVYWTNVPGTGELKTVTVTGESVGDGTGYDFATARYDATDGSNFWDAVVRFDNPDVHGEDRATDMAVDSEGNVYVGGFSENITVFQTPTLDLAAISYWWNTGAPRWYDASTMRDFVTYNGSANGTDRAAAIRVSIYDFGTDPLGNVFLFGSVTANVSYTTLVRHAVAKWLQQSP